MTISSYFNPLPTLQQGLRNFRQLSLEKPVITTAIAAGVFGLGCFILLRPLTERLVVQVKPYSDPAVKIIYKLFNMIWGSKAEDEPYLPNDMLKKIFSEADIQGLGTIACFNKNCNKLASPILRKKIYDEICFNPAHWNKYCGDGTVSNEEIDKAFKLLPQNINEILKSPCPAFPGKRVMDTHMLIWIPKSINGKPLTIDSFGEFLKQQPEFANNPTGYRRIGDHIAQQEGGNQIKSGWVLMTTDVIPDSRKKSYDKQQKMVANLNKSGQTDYRVPKTGEAIVCIMADYLRSKKRLFSDDPWTYTRCQENVRGYQVIVGGFASSGLSVDDHICNCGSIGVAGLREL